MTERLDLPKITEQMINDLSDEIDAKNIIATHEHKHSKEKPTQHMSVLEAAVDQNLTDISKIKSELEITGPNETLEYQLDVLVTSNFIILELIEQGIRNKNVAYRQIELRKESLQSEYEEKLSPQRLQLLSDAVFHSQDVISEL